VIKGDFGLKKGGFSPFVLPIVLPVFR